MKMKITLATFFLAMMMLLNSCSKDNSNNGDLTIWTPYATYVTITIDGTYVGSTTGAGVSNGVTVTTNANVSHNIVGNTTASYYWNGYQYQGGNWTYTLTPFGGGNNMTLELQ